MNLGKVQIKDGQAVRKRTIDSEDFKTGTQMIIPREVIQRGTNGLKKQPTGPLVGQRSFTPKA